MTQFGVRPRMHGSVFFAETPTRAVGRALIPPSDVMLRRLRKIDRAFRAYSRVREAVRRRMKIADRIVDVYVAGRDAETAPTLSAILAAVCARHGVTADQVRSHRRGRKIMDARREFYIRAVSETAKTYTQIGRFCCRDHSTVMHFARRNNV